MTQENDAMQLIRRAIDFERQGMHESAAAAYLDAYQHFVLCHNLSKAISAKRLAANCFIKSMKLSDAKRELDEILDGEMSGCIAPLVKAQCQASRGLVALSDKRYANALDDLLEAEQILSRQPSIASSPDIGEILGALGFCFSETGRLTMASNVWKRAIQYFNNNGDKAQAAKIHGHLGLLYKSKIGNIQYAIDHFTTAAANFNEVGNDGQCARCLVELTDILLNTFQWDQAANLSAKAAKIFQMLAQSENQAGCYLLHGQALAGMKCSNDAMAIIHEAKNIFLRINDNKSASLCDDKYEAIKTLLNDDILRLTEPATCILPI